MIDQNDVGIAPKIKAELLKKTANSSAEEKRQKQMNDFARISAELKAVLKYNEDLTRRLAEIKATHESIGVTINKIGETKKRLASSPVPGILATRWDTISLFLCVSSYTIYITLPKCVVYNMPYMYVVYSI